MILQLKYMILSDNKKSIEGDDRMGETIVLKEGREKKGGLNSNPATPKPNFSPPPQKPASKNK